MDGAIVGENIDVPDIISGYVNLADMKLIESLKKNVLTDFNGFYYVNKDNLSICKWVRFDRNDLQTYPCYSINLKDKNNIKAN